MTKQKKRFWGSPEGTSIRFGVLSLARIIIKFFQVSVFLFQVLFLHLHYTNQLKLNIMKKSAKSISSNSDLIIPVFFATLLIGLIFYNIITHGIANTSSFEF